MIRPVYRTIVLSLTLLALSGCIGAGIVTQGVSSWNIGDNGFSAPCPGEKAETTLCSQDKVRQMTPEIIAETWGVPKRDYVTNGQRLLVYNVGIAWRGIVIFIGIPIPLLLPLGHNEATLYFQDGHLVKFEYGYNWLTAAVCGLHSEGPNGFGCIADWH
jgi:hypothetical protein